MIIGKAASRTGARPTDAPGAVKGRLGGRISYRPSCDAKTLSFATILIQPLSPLQRMERTVNMTAGSLLTTGSEMQNNDLRRTAEHIWSAWLDLSYAFADLADKDGTQLLRLEIGSSVKKLRAIAETIDGLATGSVPGLDLTNSANRSLTGSAAPPYRRGSWNCGWKCGLARHAARRSRASH